MIPTRFCKTHPGDTLHNPLSFLPVCTAPKPGASPLPKHSQPKLSTEGAPEKPEIDTGISPRRISCSPALSLPSPHLQSSLAQLQTLQRNLSPYTRV